MSHILALEHNDTLQHPETEILNLAQGYRGKIQDTFWEIRLWHSNI